MLITFEDNIKESLDIMDNSYQEISKILQYPLTFDDPHVRSVQNEIRKTGDAILRIAKKVSNVNNKNMDDST